MSARNAGGPAADAQPQARHARRAPFSNPRTRRTCVEHQEIGGARHRRSDGPVASRPGQRRLAQWQGRRQGPDDRQPPRNAGKEAAALKQAAQDKVLKGEAKAVGKNKVVKVAKGQFVELAFEGEDQIFTLLGEFGSMPATHDHGQPSPPGLGIIAHGGPAGPSHNQIPEPDRTVDNSTIWTADFSQAHYDDLLYTKGTNPSMANWYLEQSSGATASMAMSAIGSRFRTTLRHTAAITAAASSARATSAGS